MAEKNTEVQTEIQQALQPAGAGEVVLYQPDETISLAVRLDTNAETVWLNRQQMAQLFGRDVKTIGKHINNALREELAQPTLANNAITHKDANQVVANFATTATDGKTYQVEYYNLDVIARRHHQQTYIG